jgi:glutaryl-CoA dehydrogenase
MLPGSTVRLKAPLSCLTQARYGITWGVIGAAQACLSEVLEYSKTRILFDRPIAATQAVQIRSRKWPVRSPPPSCCAFSSGA